MIEILHHLMYVCIGYICTILPEFLWFWKVRSIYGHDGFLLSTVVTPFRPRFDYAMELLGAFWGPKESYQKLHGPFFAKAKNYAQTEACFKDPCHLGLEGY